MSSQLMDAMMRDKLDRVQGALARLQAMPFIPFEVVQPLGDLSALLGVMVNQIDVLRSKQHDNTRSKKS